MSYHKPSYTFIRESFVHKYSVRHTLQPQNVSIIQNQKFLCLCLFSVFITYSFCLVALLGATWQGWRFCSLVYSFSSLPISDQTVTPHRFQITLPAITKDLAWVLLKKSDIFIFPTLSLSLIRGR